VSRNAVLGKAHRLGLAQRERKGGSTPRPRTPTRPPEPPTPTEPPSRQDPGPVPGPASEQPTRQPQVTSAPVEEVPPRSEGVTIMELREFMCRWPVGDPTTRTDCSASGLRDTGLSLTRPVPQVKAGSGSRPEPPTSRRWLPGAARLLAAALARRRPGPGGL
jgi:GcrA cell cycle regulator